MVTEKVEERHASVAWQFDGQPIDIYRHAMILRIFKIACNDKTQKKVEASMVGPISQLRARSGADSGSTHVCFFASGSWRGLPYRAPIIKPILTQLEPELAEIRGLYGMHATREFQMFAASCREDRNTKSRFELQHATPNYLPYVNNRIVSHDVQVVMQIYRWIAVGRYECDDAAKRQAIRRSWKGETTVLISEK
jgi:hypothetical protein